MNLQEGIFPSQERFLLTLSEVLTGQNSLQREQGKNIVVHFIIFSPPSPIKLPLLFLHARSGGSGSRGK